MIENKEQTKIQKLSPEVIKKVAAGEVVQNPASVVKEIIENSIDAKATEIFITIEDGGKSLIHILDNGAGIPKDELLLAIENHATSKISTEDDLYNVQTLGLRGEALFCINAVSQLKIISRTSEISTAFFLENEELGETSSKVGTSIFVRNIFYNTPARLKFLKGKNYESQLVEEVIESYAVAYENINFTFNKNGKIITYKNPILKAFNYEFSDNIKINFTMENYHIYGDLLNGVMGYKYMIFVNKRWIKDRRILNIIKKKYREISGKENISFVLFVDCPSNLIDVNVHPAKTEIRFQDSLIYEYISKAVEYAMHNNLSDYKSNEIILNNQKNIFSENKNLENNRNILDNKILKNMENTLENRILETNTLENRILENKENTFNNYGNNFRHEKDIGACSGHLDRENICREENIVIERDIFWDDLRIIGQYSLRYILCENQNNLVLFDQHAAHERIVAESFEKESIMQKLLNPLMVKYSGQSLENLGKLMEFDVIGDYIRITAVLSFLPSKYIDKLVYFFEDGKNPEMVLFDFIHEYGCKNSIRSGDKLSTESIEELLKTLRKTKNNHFCNHGRRIFIVFPRNKLDSMFGR